MNDSKYPSEYGEPKLGKQTNFFTPEFLRDTNGKFLIPLPGYSKFFIGVKPGSKDISQGSESSSGGPETAPSSLKTGYLYASTAIFVGPENGWVLRLAGGDDDYPLVYYNSSDETQKNFYVTKTGDVYLKGDITATSGTIGGWTISATELYAGSGITRVGLRPGSWPFYAGANDPATAPFRVDVNGNVTASSLIITGYIPTGGAAADVNAGATTISGGKITTNSIAATTIIAGQLIVGTNVGLGTAQDSTGVTTIVGNTVTTGYVNALNITTANLAATSITSGNFTVGGVNQPGNIKIIESTSGGGGTTTAKLYWQSVGGTLRGKIWGDASGYMGYNAIGGYHYFYTANNENVVMIDGNQTIFNNGISCRGAFNVGVPGVSSYLARFTNKVYFNNGTATDQYLEGASNMMTYYALSYHYFNINNIEYFKISLQGTSISKGFFYIKAMSGADAGSFASQNGAMYYRTDDNTFRMYGNGAWHTVYTF